MDTIVSPEKFQTIDNSFTSGSLVLMVFDDTTNHSLPYVDQHNILVSIRG